ncbi:MAG: hypothetical protein K9J42_11420 [Sulfuritalea sp.]|nr:hypothetical protein [Sulfuritalea sp.]
MGHSLAVALDNGFLTVTSSQSVVNPIMIGCGDEIQELRVCESVRFAIN